MIGRDGGHHLCAHAHFIDRAARAADARVGRKVQKRRHGEASHEEKDVGLQNFELTAKEHRAGRDFVRLGIAVSGRTALQDVQNRHVLAAFDSENVEHGGEELSALSHEGNPLKVFFAARRFAHDHEARFAPFFGKDGKYVTSRHIKERLDRELERNLALRVEPGQNSDSFIVYGRGVLHLSVLIETMRREGYELQVGQPKVIIKEIDGKKCEPIEEMTVDCPDEYAGTVIEMTTKRKGTLTNMESSNGRTRLEFDIPSRGIIGLRSNMLTATAGEAIMTHRLKDFEPWTGDIEMRTNGSLIASETGTAYAYSIDKLQDRGRFFIEPMEQVYCGQVIGESTRSGDITVNVTKAKQLTNMRASGSDDKAVIVPPIKFSLEEALEYIKEDEYVEVTPKAIRLRKILLNEVDRKRAAK